MKQRIITALVGLVVLGAVLAFYETIVLDAVVAVLILLLIVNKRGALEEVS